MNISAAMIDQTNFDSGFQWDIDRIMICKEISAYVCFWSSHLSSAMTLNKLRAGFIH